MIYRLTCAVCSHPFDAARPHAETCGSACRSRRFRARSRTRQAAEVERAAALLAAMRAASEMTPEG